ncbi:nucleotide-binding protein [Candidatus Uhrbacteria bacterium]|nr:nucleotide-binding protein [Candidatus Uhrbacteria bacterium]
MISRFQGADGRRRLVDALCSQNIVGGNQAIADALAEVAQLLELKPKDVLIEQGGSDDDLYLILSGSLTVIINGRALRTRVAGDHVGEMAMLDPGARRSATIIAAESALVAKISESNFTKVAQHHPQLWRAFAVELAERLRQRTPLIRPPNEKAVVFIGSSKEALPIASKLKEGLAAADVITLVWKDGIFGPSRYTMEDLEAQLSAADFAVLVAAPDDVVISRGEERGAPRDNVIFELGLFMGALSRSRAFMVVPRDYDAKIPSDLLGLLPVRYGGGTQDADVEAVCATLTQAIAKLGPR